MYIHVQSHSSFGYGYTICIMSFVVPTACGMTAPHTYRPVFQSGGNKLDLTADFTPFHKQERERLGNDDILKILSEFKKLASTAIA